MINGSSTWNSLGISTSSHPNPHLTIGETETQTGMCLLRDQALAATLWLAPPPPSAASPSSLSLPPAEPRTIPGRCGGGGWSCRLGTSGLPGLLAQRNQPLSAPPLCLLLPASPHTQLGPISFWRKPGGGPGARKQGAFSTDLCLTPDLVGGQAPKESEHLHAPVHTFSAFPPSHPSCRGAGEQRG